MRYYCTREGIKYIITLKKCKTVYGKKLKKKKIHYISRVLAWPTLKKSPLLCTCIDNLAKIIIEE